MRLPRTVQFLFCRGRTCSMPRTWMGSVWNPCDMAAYLLDMASLRNGGTNSIAYQLVTKEMSVKEAEVLWRQRYPQPQRCHLMLARFPMCLR